MQELRTSDSQFYMDEDARVDKTNLHQAAQNDNDARRFVFEHAMYALKTTASISSM